VTDGQPHRRWRRWRRDHAALAPLSHVCPSCKTAGPRRLRPDELCPMCSAQQAWAAADAAGVLVIDRGSIAEALRRRQRAREPRWRRVIVWLPALCSLAVAVLAVWTLKVHLAPRPIGPLRVLFADLHDAARSALWTGAASLIVGIVLLVRMRRRRHFRCLSWLAAQLSRAGRRSCSAVRSC